MHKSETPFLTASPRTHYLNNINELLPVVEKTILILISPDTLDIPFNVHK